MTVNPKKSDKRIHIYTDGACSGNPGIGGWGAVLCFQGHQKKLSGTEKKSTNNRMEMMAVLEALRAVSKDNSEVVIYTDSKYVLDGSTKWIHGWKKKGWKNASKKEVMNRGIWEQIDAELPRHNITWKWVAGHSGNEGNEMADTLAVEAREKLAEELKGK